MNMARNRVVSLGLAVCLILGMALYLPGPVEVQAASVGTSGDLKLDIDRTDFTLPVGSTVYFGDYTSGGTGTCTGPVLWRVVAVDDDTLTLFCDERLERLAYGSNNDWSNSTICTWLNGTFLSTAFTPAEQAAIPLYGTTEPGNPADHVYTEIDIRQQIVLPSVAEVGTAYNQDGEWNLTEEDRKHHTGIDDQNQVQNYNWRLRSPASRPNRAAIVGINGYVGVDGIAYDRNYNANDVGVSYALAIRPTFKVDLESILLISDAANGKSVTPSDVLELANAPTDSVKLTILDNDISLSNVNIGVANSNTIDFSYNADGAYSSLSAIVQKKDGSVSHYGQLIETGSSSRVNVPAGLDHTDRLLVFAEQVNGANVTDYASEPVELLGSLEITNQPSNVSVNAEEPASFSVTASGHNLRYQWQQSINGGGSFIDIAGETNDSYNIPNTDAAMDTYQYRVIVTDQYQREITSDVAVLTVQRLSDSHSITSFTIPGQQGGTKIDDAAQTIELTMPFGTDVTNLTPTITHNGTSIRPDSGIPQDFTNPVQYIVTAQDRTTKIYTVTVSVAAGPPDGTEPFVSTNRLEIEVGDQDSFTVYLGSGTDGADRAAITSNDSNIATATPNTVDTDRTDITVNGVARGSTTISIGYSGGARDGDIDTVQVSVTDPGATPNPGGSTSSGSRSSSGGSSTRDSRVVKTQLPASVFSWDGSSTLTIDHERITPLGLLSVQWDGKTLTRGIDYNVYAGSVIVGFTEDFMATQTAGDHTVRVEFLNHYGETTVMVGSTVLAELDNNDTYNPNTGGYPDSNYISAADNPNTGDGGGVWAALLLGSLSAGVLVLYRKSRKHAGEH